MRNPEDNSPGKIDAEAEQALRNGRLIEAIKIIRQRNNVGLKEAKDIVDRYLQEHPELYPKKADSPPGKSFLLLVIAVLASIAFWIFQGRQL